MYKTLNIFPWFVILETAHVGLHLFSYEIEKAYYLNY